MSYNLPLLDGCLCLSSSTLEKFTTCPRSAKYYLIDKKVPTDTKSSLLFGRFIHKALEYRYANDGQLASSDIERGQLDLLGKLFANYVAPEGDFRTYDRAVQMVQEYNKSYSFEPFEVVRLADGKPATEIPFLLPLGTIDGIPVMWKGIIDLIITIEYQHWVVDHKTTSVLGANYFAEFYLSAQGLGYIWAAQLLLKQVFRGLMINVLANRKPTKTGVAIEFARDKIFYNPDNVEEWTNNTLQIASDLIRCCERGFFPQHMKWCVGKYGKCPYYDVCTLERSQRQTMLESGMFKDVEPSPIDSDV